jgi:hypothetical protein
MNILVHFRSGAFRSIKAWKGVLVTWAFYLFVISLFLLPVKAAFNNVLGNSMITELLNDGINIDVLTDFGPRLAVIFSSFSAGFSFIIFIVFVMNAFISGGVFAMLRSEEKIHSAKIFFEGGASNFWSFLIITFVSTLIIIVLATLILIIPMAIMSESESPQEGVVLKTGRLLAIVIFILIPIIVLVADNARAWQVTRETTAGFKSLGNGFRLTFRNFFSSYLMMVLLLSVQFFFGWIVFRILSGMNPVTGRGVFLLFLLSQVLFILKIFLKAWRYGSIISLVQSRIKKIKPVHAVQYFEI